MHQLETPELTTDSLQLYGTLIPPLQRTSMHRAHTAVQNFRCLHGLRVDLQQGLNVLVGRNDVGKTSLLATIRHALGSSPGRTEPLWLTEDDFYRPTASAPRAEQIPSAHGQETLSTRDNTRSLPSQTLARES